MFVPFLQLRSELEEKLRAAGPTFFINTEYIMTVSEEIQAGKNLSNDLGTNGSASDLILWHLSVQEKIKLIVAEIAKKYGAFAVVSVGHRFDISLIEGLHGHLIYADSYFDITKQVLDRLNKEYLASKTR